MRKNSNYINVLDLGSSKAVCLVAEPNSTDITIKGIGQGPSYGMRSGLITDLVAAKQAIARVVESAAKMSGTKIKRVSCVISPSVLISKNVKTKVSIAAKEINQNDITKLHLSVNDMIDSKDYEVLHNFIYNFNLDGYGGIVSPIGMFGKELSCNINTVLCHKNILLNYQQCLHQLGIEVESFISAPYAASYSVYSPEDFEYGALLIDLGFSSSSISYIKNKKLIFSDGVSLGGHNIINDIMQVLGVNFNTANRLKSLYGTLTEDARNDQQMIDLEEESDVANADYEHKHISKSFLGEIIRARLEEIIELLNDKLREARLPLSSKKVVLSGGMAILPGITEFIDKYGYKSKVQQPSYINGIADSIATPAFAAPLGLLHFIKEQKLASPTTSFGMGGMLRWLKENF